MANYNDFHLPRPDHPCDDEGDLFAVAYEDSQGSRVIAITSSIRVAEEKFKNTLIKELTTVQDGNEPLPEQLEELCEVLNSQQAVYRDPDVDRDNVDDEFSDDESPVEEEDTTTTTTTTTTTATTQEFVNDANADDLDSDNCDDDDDDDEDTDDDYVGNDFGIYIQPMMIKIFQVRSEFYQALYENLCSNGMLGISFDNFIASFEQTRQTQQMVNVYAVNAEDPEDDDDE